ncbi:MAG: putative transcriptional regulator, TetR family protein [Acidimicrobiales bacterium]|nr:MAG: putative transcriptional regulator, TetR family protein [Acidimicrobiales bacterium]
MARKLTARGRQRRRQIIDYAVARFAHDGYHSTSISDIVEGLGVGKGVFYWYFASKEELFLEILREAQLDLRRAQRRAIEGETGVLRMLELGIRASLAWSAEHRDLLKLFQFALTDPRFSEALRRGREVAAADLSPIVRRGMESGEIRLGDPELVTHAILGLTTYVAHTFIHERGDDPERVADELVEFCLRGLAETLPSAAPVD